VVVMNWLARDHFERGVGRMLEEVLPGNLAAHCRELSRNPTGAFSVCVEIKNRVYQVDIHHLAQAEKVHGGVLIFYHPDLVAEELPASLRLLTDPTPN
ncbi:MAG TPA: hypothetical protein VF398_06565, partial [bacterium]